MARLAIVEKPLLPSRQALSDAIARVETAKEALEQAQRVATSAQQAVDESKAGLDGFATLESLNSRFMEARFEALHGDGDPKVVDGLREDLQKRAAAADELKEAEGILSIARQKADSATVAHAEALKQRASAATAVIAERIQDALALLREADERREKLHTFISAFGLPNAGGAWWQLTPTQRENILETGLRHAGYPCASFADWREVHQQAMDALADTETTKRREPDADLTAQARSYWQSLASALLADANADAPLPTLK